MMSSFETMTEGADARRGKAIQRRTPFDSRPVDAWRNVPLLLCYVAFPLSNQLAVGMGGELYRNWIDIAWLLIVVGCLVLRWFSPLAQPSLPTKVKLVCICLALIVIVSLGVEAGQIPGITGAMELKPVLYILLCMLFVSRVSPPEPADFCRYGVALALLLIAETAALSLSARSIARPLGSGEVNYDGALLCVSLVFASADRRLAQRYGWLIWAGIIASFSRTSLVAAALILLFSPAMRLRTRLFMCLLAALAVLGSFAIRDLPIDSVKSVDRYWMWAVGLTYLFGNPLATAVNPLPGSSLDVDVPRALLDLWTDQQAGLGIDGIFPFQLHAMWLRLAVAWGWLPTLLVLLVLGRTFLLNPRRAAAANGLFIVFLTLGMTMGLIYLGNVAPVILLAAYRINLGRRRLMPRSRPARVAVVPMQRQYGPA